MSKKEKAKVLAKKLIEENKKYGFPTKRKSKKETTK